VDERLFRIAGVRPYPLTRHELPALAEAMLAYLRRQALVERMVVCDVPCVRFFNRSSGINVVVRSDDWAKVVPYLKDDTLDPLIFPTPVLTTANRQVQYAGSVLSINDHQLYARTLELLERLFTTEFPTQ
jgi:hypothetical protein